MGFDWLPEKAYADLSNTVGNSSDTNLSAVGAAPFQEQLYKSMMGQALDMKREIEEQRATNSFGMLVWQLGEVWP